MRTKTIRCPAKGKLSDEQIAILESWIKRGLPFHPEDEIQFHHEKEENWSNTVVNERTKAHWAYVKPIDHSPPSGTGAKHPIDAFILDKLNKFGLPQSACQPSALLRRAHFDLIGFPPELDQVDAFLEDHSEKHSRKQSTACSPLLTTVKNGAGTGWTCPLCGNQRLRTRWRQAHGLEIPRLRNTGFQ